MYDELEFLKLKMAWIWDYEHGLTDHRPRHYVAGDAALYAAAYRELTGRDWDPETGTEKQRVSPGTGN